MVRNADEQKFTSQILDKDNPPGKWWHITKSISKLSNTHKPVPPFKSQGQILLHLISLVSMRIKPNLNMGMAPSKYHWERIERVRAVEKFIC